MLKLFLYCHHYESVNRMLVCEMPAASLFLIAAHEKPSENGSY